MIVCKIMADFVGSQTGDFAGIFESLSEKGGVLCVSQNVLYFGSTDPKVDQKWVKRDLRRFGYGENVVSEFSVSSPPREGALVDGWVFDWLASVTVARVEALNQAKLDLANSKLDALEAELEAAGTGMRAEKQDTEDRHGDEQEKEKTDGVA